LTVGIVLKMTYLFWKKINLLRMQSEAHEAEKEAELGFVRQMYGQPPIAEQPQ